MGNRSCFLSLSKLWPYCSLRFRCPPVIWPLEDFSNFCLYLKTQFKHHSFWKTSLSCPHWVKCPLQYFFPLHSLTTPTLILWNPTVITDVLLFLSRLWALWPLPTLSFQSPIQCLVQVFQWMSNWMNRGMEKWMLLFSWGSNSLPKGLL